MTDIYICYWLISLIDKSIYCQIAKKEYLSLYYLEILDFFAIESFINKLRQTPI